VSVRDHHQRRTASELLEAGPAHAALADPAFLEDWQQLWARCPWATAYQAPAFVRAWYTVYGANWQPVIALTREPDGSLTGLWLLAHHVGRGTLAHAGAHQAEYQTWLAVPGADAAFLHTAWGAIRHRFPSASLTLRYLPAADLGATLMRALQPYGSIVTVRTHLRPLLRLTADEVRASFAKKSNKSRFNRLKRLGALDFRRVVDGPDLDRVFDTITQYYDLRQGAIHNTTPFRSDPQKRPFHRAWLMAATDQPCVTVTTIDNQPVAGFWGAVSRDVVHLGILAYSPLLAEHSPGKLHIMQLSDYLLQAGVTVLDLTPGGDPWKERFANAHDDVADAVIHASARARALSDLRERMAGRIKRWLGRLGLSSEALTDARTTVARIRPAVVLRALCAWVYTHRELRIYRLSRAASVTGSRDPRVRGNAVDDLLSFAPAERWQRRERFLSDALSRLESGEQAYTITIDGRLAHSGWLVKGQAVSQMAEVAQAMRFPDGSVALYGFYTDPDFRGQGLYRATVGHMLAEAFADETTQYAYISVLADNTASRHVIESTGFAYQGSFSLTRRLGRETTGHAGDVSPVVVLRDSAPTAEPEA